MVLALASAYRREFRLSTEYLQKTMSSYSEEVSSLIPGAVPVQLLALWKKTLAIEDLSALDLKNWIVDLDRVMKVWQPLRRERQSWLTSLSALAHQNAWVQNGAGIV